MRWETLWPSLGNPVSHSHSPVSSLSDFAEENYRLECIFTQEKHFSQADVQGPEEE